MPTTRCIRALSTSLLLRVVCAARVELEEDNVDHGVDELEQDVPTDSDSIRRIPFNASHCVQALTHSCRVAACPRDKVGPYPCIDGICHCRRGQCQVGNRCEESCRQSLPIRNEIAGGNFCARRGLLKTETGYCACASDACFVRGACVKTCPKEGWSGPLQCIDGICSCVPNTCAVNGVCTPTVAVSNVTLPHKIRDYSNGRCKMEGPLTNSVMWDRSCTANASEGSGCMADGKNAACRLCGSSLLQPRCPESDSIVALNEMQSTTSKKKDNDTDRHLVPLLKSKPMIMKSITYRPLHCPLYRQGDPKWQALIRSHSKLSEDAEAFVSMHEHGILASAESSFIRDCDSWAAEIETFWGGRGRGDLRSIKAMGANTVRVVGGNPWKKHDAFLNEAASLGLDVSAGINDFPYVQSRNCEDTENDCFSLIMLWHKRSLQSGIMKQDRTYHEALKYYVIVERPEKMIGEGNPRLWTKMMLSAFDGFLEAERSMNVKNPESVTLTVTFSDETCIACEHGEISGIGQMWELKKAMRDPRSYGYTPKNDILGLFLSRFVYSIRSFTSASRIRPFLEHFDRLFPEHHVFLADYHGLANNVAGAVPQNDLSLAVSEAMKPKSKLFGISFFEFIARTDEDGAIYDDTIARMGLFENGEHEVPIHIPHGNVTHSGGALPRCLKWFVDRVRGEDNIAAVFQAFHLPFPGKMQKTKHGEKSSSVLDMHSEEEDGAEAVENMVNLASEKPEKAKKRKKDLTEMRGGKTLSSHRPGKEKKSQRVMKDSIWEQDDLTDLYKSVPARQAKCEAFGAR